jgi:IclR family pca regulon transcriptional regulator
MTVEGTEPLSSLATGMAVLEFFHGEQQSLSLAQLTAMLDVRDAAKVRPYTSMLLADRYLEQTATQDYRLGARAGDVALAMLDALPARWGARRALLRLRARTGYTASLLALDGTDAVYLSRMRGSRRGQHAIDDGIGVGARQPAHQTAAGRAVLAHLAPPQRKMLIAELVAKYRSSDKTLTKRRLHSECMIILRTGLAVSGRANPPQCSIAAPVADRRGAVVAAIEVSIPDGKGRRDALDETLGPELRNEAKTIRLPTDDFLGRTG